MRMFAAMYWASLVFFRVYFTKPPTTGLPQMFKGVPDWFIFEVAQGDSENPYVRCARCELLVRYHKELSQPEPGSPEFKAWVAEDTLY